MSKAIKICVQVIKMRTVKLTDKLEFNEQITTDNCLSTSAIYGKI